MRKIIFIAVASIALSIGAASAYAGSDSDAGSISAECKKNRASEKCRTRPQAVPEIDATSGGPAIALVLGAILLGAERRRHLQRAR